MSKKFGLGKGLNALIPEETILGTLDNKLEKTNEKEKGSILIDINLIKNNEDQPRKSFDDEKILELSESIKGNGIIQPLILRKVDDEYVIVAGERRWRAAKLIGLKEVPAIIMNLTEKQILEISLIENIQREDLNPIEKARGIKQLMDEYNLTQQKVAEKLGKSRSSIANTVRILNLDERVINLALEGKLTEGHCKSLMAIDDSERQYKMAQYIIESGDSVREAEKKMKVRKKVSKKNDKYIPIYRDIENTFQGFFGTKVKLDAGERKGKIIIQYSSNDDLERILGLIK